MTEHDHHHGLPPGADRALAAAIAPRLRAHPARTGRPGDPEASDLAVWDTAGRAETLDVLWDAGLLTVPGGSPRPPLYREPLGPISRDAVRHRVAAALAPQLRAHHDPELSPGDLLEVAGKDEVLDALWQSGLLTLDHGDDRAHLRAGWAAMGAALHHLSRHEDLPEDLLARIPRSHLTYLLGHQERARQLAAAWARIEAAKMLVATIRDRHDGDIAYLRTNLAVLQGLLDGHVHWSLGMPRDVGSPRDASLYEEIRHRAARFAVDSERLFAAAGEALLGGPGRRPDPALATQHLFAHRAALYAWGVVALLGYIREHFHDEYAADAAAIVDMIGKNGDPPYVDDLPRPDLAESSRDNAGVVAAIRLDHTADQAGGRQQRPLLGGIATELATLDDLALDLWRRGGWERATAALPGPLRELIADAADRAIARYNAGVHAAGYTGMSPVDRWWKTGQPVERAVRYLGGPRHGDERTEPLAIIPGGHGMPSGGPDGAARWVFAAADSWPGQERYAPEGYDDQGRLLMVWRHATNREVAAARAERAERDAERAQEIALDEAASSWDDAL